jgi:V/A-type H+-transporting ATPase subunit I
MIVPMKKVTIIVQEHDARRMVAQVRALGVVHVQHHRPPQGKDMVTLQEESGRVDAALGAFRLFGLEGKERLEVSEPKDVAAAVKHIISLGKHYEQLCGYERALLHSIHEYEPWGDFDPAHIQGLSGKGVIVRLYQLHPKQVHDFPQGVTVQVIRITRGVAYCAAIAREPFEVPFKEVALPHQGLENMRSRLEEDRKTMARIKEEMQRQYVYYGWLVSLRGQLEKEIEFAQAVTGMGQQGRLAYFSGYIPEDALGTMRVKAKEQKWGLLIEEVSDDGSIPTLLRNPRWVRLISPVLKLLEIVPGYRELDISPLFLLFLSLFFGMIISDAGYGVVYIVIAFLLQRKYAQKIKDKRIFPLIYLFSSCAIFWGVLTGTVFGQEWFIRAGGKPIAPLLNDTNFLQAVCFFIGAVHLSLAHLWQAVRKSPSITAFADVGWVGVLWGAFFLARTLILNDPFPFFGKWLIIAGISLVICCTSPQKNILKMIGGGLGTVALSLVNNFTDVVSYVRLFAVGLAGIAISDTVNALATSFGGNPLVKILILLVGHTINIVLGPMSVLVHGIRLNVLEFSGHAGLSWSGIAYKPLKE